MGKTYDSLVQWIRGVLRQTPVCFSCDRQPMKYATGLCQGCHVIAMRTSGLEP